MSEDQRDRLIALERDVVHLLDESRAIRTALHSLVATAMTEHAGSIARLAAAQEHRSGIWYTIAWLAGGIMVVGGALAWLLEHNVQIIIKS